MVFLPWFLLDAARYIHTIGADDAHGLGDVLRGQAARENHRRINLADHLTCTLPVHSLSGTTAHIGHERVQQNRADTILVYRIRREVRPDSQRLDRTMAELRSEVLG